MSNGIPQKQNELVNLVRASRQVYRQSKFIGNLQLMLSLMVAVGGPIAVGIISYKYPTFAAATKGWVGLFSITTVLIDAVLFEPQMKILQELGARLQDQFDTQVYELPWNEVKVGRYVDAGKIGELVDRHRNKFISDEKFLDWYPVIVGQVPIRFARLICQGSSMRWDATLRMQFCRIYASILFALLIGSFTYAMAAGYDMPGVVLSVLMPLLPAARQVWREYRRNLDAAAEMERATNYMNLLWSALLSGSVEEKEAEHRSRLLQDELFDRRRRAPAIPEFLYQFSRKDLEEDMKRVAAERVTEVNKKLGMLVS